MDKLKSMLSSGNKRDDEIVHDNPTSTSSRLGGEGSHFGTGGTGTDSAGYSLGKDTEGHGFSAAEATGNTDSAGYDIARGPGTFGTSNEGNHMNTRSSALAGDDGLGQANVGQTSTYSSNPLPSRDNTSNVIDPNSSDANTFRRPEVSSAAGVGPHAAETAARRAMDPSSEQMPGGFPVDTSNPYAASSIDPRVDSAGHAPVRQSHLGRDTALGAGAGAAGLGTYESTRTQDPMSSTTGQSTMGSTTNPLDRSQGYESTNEGRGIDSANPTTTSTSGMTTADDPTQKKGMVGTVLGALGLGGGTAAARNERGNESALDTNPSTSTGVGSYGTSGQSGPHASHHRKESIPTTAYPSGNLDSVRANAGPTGQSTTSDSHLGRDAAIGAGGLGAAGLGAREFENRREPTTGTGSSALGSGMTGTNSGVAGLGEREFENRGPSGGLGNSGLGSGMTGTNSGVAGLGEREFENSRQPMTGAGNSALGSGMTGTGAGVAGLGEREFENRRQPGMTGTNSGVAGLGERELENRREPTTGAGNSALGSGIAGASSDAPDTTVHDLVTGGTPLTSQASEGDSRHYARDAAIGGAALGATGLGAHEYEKNRDSGLSSGVNPGSQQYGDRMTGAPQLSQLDSQNYGRDGAIGGGAIGGSGLGRNNNESIAPGVSSGVTPTSQQYGNQPIDSAQTSQQGSHHYGRDAAIGGGALGAAGLGAGAYDAERHHGQGGGITSGNTPSSQQYGDQPLGKRENFSQQVDPRTDAAGYPKSGTGVGAVPAGAQPGSQHHYGRDAAVVGGGAAATGLAAHEYSEHDSKKVEKEHNKLQKNQSKEMAKEEKAHEKEVKKEHKAEVKAEKKHEKELAKEEKREAKEERKEEKLAAKEEKQHEKADAKDSKHHHGTEGAAVGAGGVGAAAYEAEKHHQSSNRGGGLAAADAADAQAYNKQSRYIGDPANDPTVRKTGLLSGGGGTDHHYGRDAAVGTVGAGGLGAAAYEAEKHHGQGHGATGETRANDPYYNRQQLPESAIAGQQTATGLTGSQHHYGRDAAVGTVGAGALGTGAYEAEQHHGHGHGTHEGTQGTHGTDPYYNRHQLPDSAVAGQETGTGMAGTGMTDTQHHYGRDAAIGGAGAGALGTAAYEAERHHSQGHGTTTGGTQSNDPYYNRQQLPERAIAGQQTGTGMSGTGTGNTGNQHYGRDAAIGGAGAGALGTTAYEAEKHHDHSTDSHRKSGLAAADEDDRRAYGSGQEKKPGLFTRMFKKKQNVNTGEMEDDENDYEDVPHDHAGGVGSGVGGVGGSGHQQGELTKPSYNPFKAEDSNVKPVEGRI